MPGKKPPLRQIRFEAPFTRGVGGAARPLGGRPLRGFGAGEGAPEGPLVIPPYQNREPGGACAPGSNVWTPGGREPWQPPDPPARDIPTNGMILGHPIVLTAICVVNPNDRQTPNVLALRCPDRKAFLLEEIRFGMVATGYTGASNVAIAATIGCLLGVDKDRMITPNIVPVSMFDAPFCSTSNTGGAVVGSASLERWRLPEPLYLAPGEILTPTFEHFGLSNVPVTIVITYHGRVVVSGKPTRYCLPFCIAWRPVSFDINAAAPTTLNSTEEDLINPFQEPLRVKRFGGRLYITRTNTTGGTAGIVIEEATQGLALYDGTALTLRASRGSDVVRVASRWLSVFDGEGKEWLVDHVLPPGDHYIASVATGLMATAAGVSGIAYISMSGYREVK